MSGPASVHVRKPIAWSLRRYDRHFVEPVCIAVHGSKFAERGNRDGIVPNDTGQLLRCCRGLTQWLYSQQRTSNQRYRLKVFARLIDLVNDAVMNRRALGGHAPPRSKIHTSAIQITGAVAYYHRREQLGAKLLWDVR